MEPKYYQIPAWIVELYPDLGICTFSQQGYTAPLLTTQDPAAFKKGRFVVYRTGTGDDFSCGALLDMRGGLYVLDDVDRGLCEVTRNYVLGVAVGVLLNTGEVKMDDRA